MRRSRWSFMERYKVWCTVACTTWIAIQVSFLIVRMYGVVERWVGNLLPILPWLS